MVGKKLIIFGVGDFARIAHYYLKHDSPHKIVAHTVTIDVLEERHFLNVPVVPFEELPQYYPPGDFAMLIGVAYSGVNKNRTAMFEQAKSRGYQMISYVCSKAVTWPDLSIGEGTFIFESNVIQPYVKIGNNSVLWSGNHIGHDSIIGNNVFIASHVVISGNCKIGDNTFIGVNATVRDGITIGEECVIGAGAVILRNAPDRAVFKGSATPAAGITSRQLTRI